MKKWILFCLIFIIYLGGCASNMRCYQVQDYPTVCIVETICLEDEMMEYFKERLSLTVTKKYHWGFRKNIVTSFYVKEKNILYAKNDPEVIFTQLWYFKNKTLPNWPLKNMRIFEIKEILNFLNETHE